MPIKTKKRLVERPVEHLVEEAADERTEPGRKKALAGPLEVPWGSLGAPLELPWEAF